ncbi:unnamed protein product [Boreogadus saida]
MADHPKTNPSYPGNPQHGLTHVQAPTLLFFQGPPPADLTLIDKKNITIHAHRTTGITDNEIQCNTLHTNYLTVPGSLQYAPDYTYVVCGFK